jgi:uncharacterized repeat protein (TIGR01451 family)
VFVRFLRAEPGAAGRSALRGVSLGLVVVVAALAASVTAAEAASTPVSSFAKSGHDATTSSTAAAGGAAGSAAPGDTIDWTLSYRNSTSGQAQVDLTDPITGNQTFVPGSLKTPSGFSPLWSTDGGSSFVTSEPGAGVNAIGATGTSVAGSTGAQELASPPAVSSVPGSGNGDGWEALFIGDNVYNVFHIGSGLGKQLDCHVKATGARCANFPYAVSATAGDPLGTVNGTLTTGLFEKSIVVGTKIYFAAGRVGTTQLGVGCADVDTLTSCGFTRLASAASNILANSTAPINGGAMVGGRYYLTGPAAAILCFDTATGVPCPDNPIANVADPGRGGATALPPLETWDGQHLYGVVTVSTQRDLICVEAPADSACPGFPKVNYASQGTFPNSNTAMVPLLDASGHQTGICGSAAANVTSQSFKCYDLAGNATPSPFSQQIAGTGVGPSNSASVAVVGTRVYFPESTPSAGAATTYTCFDEATSAPCAGFVPGSTGANVRPYSLRQDPQNPDCIWELGDTDIFEVFSATFGGTSCNEGNAQVAVTPGAYYCDGQAGHVTGWDQIRLGGIGSADYDAVAVTITDANGDPVPGWQGKIFDNTSQSIDVSSIPYSGSTTTLHVAVAISWGAHPVTPVTVDATFAGDAPQVCFQTTVGPAQCSVAQPISNDANAVTDAGLAGDDAPGGNDSGTATFLEAADPTLPGCEADLSIAKTASTSSVPPGGQVTYTLVVDNHGPDTATGAHVSDVLPAGLSLVSALPSQGSCVMAATIDCALGTIVNGGSARILVTANVDASATGSIQNCAAVSAVQPDPASANDSGCATVTVVPQPQMQASSDLRIVKRASLTSTYPGRTITYTIDVSNLGPAAAGDVKVTDTPSIPLRVVSVQAGQGSCQAGPPITCSLGVIAAGHGTTVTVRAIAQRTGTETNTASVTSANREVDPANNVASAITKLAPVLRLRKTALLRQASAGERVRYRIKVTNPTAVSIARVRVCDLLPARLRYAGASRGARVRSGRPCWTIARLAAGRSKTLTVTVRVTAGRGGVQTNRATATASGVRAARASAPLRVISPTPPCGPAGAARRRTPPARAAC